MPFRKVPVVILFTTIFFSGIFAVSFPSPALSSQTEVYFSPKGGIENKIISRINLSKKSIKIAIFSFTSGEIAGALESAKKRGVSVKISADKGQSTGKQSEIKYLISKGIDIRLKKGKGKYGIMHNKFAVFDENEVVTGSFNWTNNAEYNNYENVIFIKDAEIAKIYSREFDRIFGEEKSK
jgi:phosphatidylserine/phosphatidylglycerophosphate/cardiolipin synthase-like enzyme